MVEPFAAEAQEAIIAALEACGRRHIEQSGTSPRAFDGRPALLDARAALTDAIVCLWQVDEEDRAAGRYVGVGEQAHYDAAEGGLDFTAAGLLVALARLESDLEARRRVFGSPLRLLVPAFDADAIARLSHEDARLQRAAAREMIENQAEEDA